MRPGHQSVHAWAAPELACSNNQTRLSRRLTRCSSLMATFPSVLAFPSFVFDGEPVWPMAHGPLPVCCPSRLVWPRFATTQLTNPLDSSPRSIQ